MPRAVGHLDGRPEPAALESSKADEVSVLCDGQDSPTQRAVEVLVKMPETQSPSGTRQVAAEAVAENDHAVSNGLVRRKRGYAERCKDKRIFGERLTASSFAQFDVDLELEIVHVSYLFISS